MANPWCPFEPATVVQAVSCSELVAVRGILLHPHFAHFPFQVPSVPQVISIIGFPPAFLLPLMFVLKIKFPKILGDLLTSLWTWSKGRLREHCPHQRSDSPLVRMDYGPWKEVTELAGWEFLSDPGRPWSPSYRKLGPPSKLCQARNLPNAWNFRTSC